MMILEKLRKMYKKTDLNNEILINEIDEIVESLNLLKRTMLYFRADVECTEKLNNNDVRYVINNIACFIKEEIGR